MTISVIFTTISQPAFAITSADVNQQIDEVAQSPLFLEGKACDKLDTLWSAIYASRESADNLVPFQTDQVKAFLAGTSTRFWKSFGDSPEIKPENYLRLTHRHGVFAQARLVIEPEFQNRYTGLLKKGSDCVLVRFSSAVSPATSWNRFTPGFAAKFFIDGKHSSENLIVQHSIAGQGNNINYYEYPLSNKLKFIENQPAGFAAFSRFFNATQDYLKNESNLKMVDPRELSIQHLASINAKGKTVDNPESPRFIFLVPPEGRAFSQEQHDFRQDFLALNQGIPANDKGQVKKDQGVRLFDVYVADQFTDNPKAEAQRIGYFESKSHFAVSDTADIRVSFRHSITPRETQDYPGEYPKSLFNDESFTSECATFGASLADMQPNPQDASGNTSIYFQNYLKRGCKP
ncbi:MULTISPECIES: hypothetical protein [unclassified Anabaena]|uniref:hypothetical protein n=1 Tax=unclassified Anabaena TaxID=2619674 RepID=UPI0012E76464|nr:MULTISPECIES: hypothetical protein [unclassified Anabaena]